MEFLIWIGLVGGTLFLIWYGYGLLARRTDPTEVGASLERAQCHLCRREYPLREMVTRQKAAGFENHFCGDCIEELYRDYTERATTRRAAGTLPGRN
jgi:hypothetical protein